MQKRNDTVPHLFSIQRLQRIDRLVARLRMMLDPSRNCSRRTRPHVDVFVP